MSNSKYFACSPRWDGCFIDGIRWEGPRFRGTQTIVVGEVGESRRRYDERSPLAERESLVYYTGCLLGYVRICPRTGVHWGRRTQWLFTTALVGTRESVARHARLSRRRTWCWLAGRWLLSVGGRDWSVGGDGVARSRRFSLWAWRYFDVGSIYRT